MADARSHNGVDPIVIVGAKDREGVPFLNVEGKEAERIGLYG